MELEADLQDFFDLVKQLLSLSLTSTAAALVAFSVFGAVDFRSRDILSNVSIPSPLGARVT